MNLLEMFDPTFRYQASNLTVTVIFFAGAIAGAIIAPLVYILDKKLFRDPLR